MLKETVNKMRLKKTKQDIPSIIVIPMIDIMFFLLVFFMLSTMYMTNLKTVSVKLSNVQGSTISQDVAFAVTVNDKGDLFIGDAKVDMKTLQQYAQKEIERDPNAIIVLRTDENSSYKNFSEVISALKTAGVARFGIATDAGE